MIFDSSNVNKLKFATPYYLISENIIRNNCSRFLNAFTKHYKRIRAYYSIKTNYELEVLRIIRDMKFGAEISGGLELFFTKKAGFAPQNIIFDGPCKTADDMKSALREKIYLFNLDSINDAKHLSELCAKEKTRAKVCFRVNPEVEGHYLTGLAESYIQKFGIPISQAKKAYENLVEDRNMEVVGINTHIGSQILSPQPHVSTLDKFMKLAKHLEKLGCYIEEINIGGGFPSKTLIKTTVKNLFLSRLGIEGKPQEVPEIEEYADKIMDVFLDKVSELNSEPYLAFEPGRFIVSNAGIYISKVIDKKDGKWLFVDGSINHVPENLFFASRKILSAEEDSKQKQNFIVAGRTLNTADILSLNAELPKDIPVGSKIVVLDCGAYTISRSNQFTTLRPSVYFIKSNKKIKKIRREENYNDISRLMS